MAGYLADEIMQEIMVRLPVKSLLRFKCLSKSWRSVLSSKKFIKKHLELNSSLDNDKQRLLILNCRWGYSLNCCSLNSLFDGKYSDVVTLDLPLEITGFFFIVFVASCNGLIFAGFSSPDSGLSCILWNPSLRKFKRLSNLGLDVSRVGADDYIVAYGFGYDESTDDYKVAFVIHDEGENSRSTEMKVYSTKTQSSKKIGDFRGFISSSNEWCGVFANGKIYWTWGDSGYCNILFVDLATDTFGEMELGNQWISDRRSLGTYGGELCLIFGSGGRVGWEVWVMNQDGGGRESWTKVLNIPGNIVKWSVSQALYISGSDNGEVLGAFDREVELYNPKDCSRRSIQGIADAGYSNILWIGCFVESMINPALDENAPRKQPADEGEKN